MNYVMPGYEKRKAVLDLYKHLGTLSVAAIAVLVSFLPSLQTLDQGKLLIQGAVISFSMTIIGTIITCIMLAAKLEDFSGKHNDSARHWFAVICMISIGFFILGVISLGCTFLVNI